MQKGLAVPLFFSFWSFILDIASIVVVAVCDVLQLRRLGLLRFAGFVPGFRQGVRQKEAPQICFGL